MPSDFERLLKGIDPLEARRPSAPGERSLVDVLRHLLAFECRYRAQLQSVVDGERLSLSVRQPDETGHELDLSVGELTECIKAARAETLAFLEGLSPGDWQRKAVHSTGDEISLRFLVHDLVAYDTQHLSQLVAARPGLHADPASVPQPAPAFQKVNPTQDTEVEYERKRTRKWPRKRRRRGN